MIGWYGGVRQVTGRSPKPRVNLCSGDECVAGCENRSVACISHNRRALTLVAQDSWLHSTAAILVQHN